MANGLRAPANKVGEASGRQLTAGADAEPDGGAQIGVGQEVGRAANDLTPGSNKIIDTTTSQTQTITTTTTTYQSKLRENLLVGGELSEANESSSEGNGDEVAVVEYLGRRADQSSLSRGFEEDARDLVEGNKLVSSVSTIGAQCGQSRLVLALYKEGDQFQMKVQEMRPPIFELGLNKNECIKLSDDHRRMLAGLRRQEGAPIEAWLQKYHKIRANEKDKLSSERQMVYMCMLENLQVCWRASLRQLDKRAQLLEMACSFYELAEELHLAIKEAENHVQLFRIEFLESTNSERFNEAKKKLVLLNKNVTKSFETAKRKQTQLIELIRTIANGNLGDARANHLASDSQNLIKYISGYLQPLQKRHIQLESVLKTTVERSNRTLISSDRFGRSNNRSIYRDDQNETGSREKMREINNLNDLHFVDNWLSLKIEQLNSSLLSSLGVGDLDSRTILSKHEQILLECRTIEDATLLFGGKNIHTVKSSASQDETLKGNKRDDNLLELQRLLSLKARDVITILEARIALLRRTIDFHIRSKEATCDIGKMMRRLQIDNSLQSVEFVANELELKDVSSVVASGATIISELQQLQLAQQAGQRSSLVNLDLITSGIRTSIDQLNQELAHLKTVLNQRKLVLLNEDVNKMANNFKQKCNQLHFWLQNSVKSFLVANDRLPLDLDGVRQFCQTHQQLRQEVQRKTLEFEALLRSLSSLTDENFDAKSKLGETIQRSMDELRQDWIMATNCLERRTTLAKKYLDLLDTSSQLGSELEALQRFQKGQTGEYPERSDEEIRANIDQLVQQLSKQLQLLRQETQKGGTELKTNRHQAGQVNDEQVNELNRVQMLEFAERMFGQLVSRKKALFEGRADKHTHDDINPMGSGQDPLESREDAKRGQPPRFKQTLNDKWAPPFSQVELECELESDNCQLEWLMNNFRKIPASIRHSISREANKHKLTIHNFGPQCSGTFLARAWNSAGQAVSRCELRLAGMNNRQSSHQSISSRGDSSLLTPRWQSSINKKEPTRSKEPDAETKAMARIVQGVESLSSKETTTTTGDSSAEMKLPVTESRYSVKGTLEQGPTTSGGGKQLPRLTSSTGFESSASSATLSRSISRSPFEGTPQPPEFIKPLCRSMSPCCSRAGLMCVVVGNPPPTIEWLHNNERVAVAKCSPRDRQSGGTKAGNICKLRIETMNELANGEYTCRASNRIGQTISNFTLSR